LGFVGLAAFLFLILCGGGFCGGGGAAAFFAGCLVGCLLGGA